MKLTVTNISRAPQGVHVAAGKPVFIRPNEARELDVADGYVERLRSLKKYFAVSGVEPTLVQGPSGKTTLKGTTNPNGVPAGPATIKHRGGGKYAVFVNDELQPGDLMQKAEAQSKADEINATAAKESEG